MDSSDIDHGASQEGSNLILVIPRDDFAKLMDLIAKIEQNDLDEHDVVEFSRIASDLSQQADGQ